MPVASRSTRHLGHACRIYKNSSSKVIAVDDLALSVDVLRISADQYHRSVSSVDSSRTLVHLGEGDRVVSTILMFGNYSSLADNGGDYLEAQWNKASDNENDVIISFEPYVAKIGDTI